MTKEVFDKIADGMREALSVARTGLIEEAITEQFGERCPDYEPGCYCCEAWRELDRLRAGCSPLNSTESNRLNGEDNGGE